MDQGIHCTAENTWIWTYWITAFSAFSAMCRHTLVETAMLHYKIIIHRAHRARTLPAQKVEARIGCKVPDRMAALGIPISRQVA